MNSKHCETITTIKIQHKRTINCNKDLSKVSTERQNPYLDYLIDPSFQEE